ncbi:putative caffeine-induced death protein cid2 protein [Neofusicoccum parvum UCRNP2]|uniref:Caffeine-induced death protein n=2 Tax=Neofusicoccum parvum TaxID=310453 RepID=A0ACB5RRF0_9PEZI|nr:putative caffeine-induced death protein cid2 protein [Neofusicoccum parvum UCRNP2]GME23100.1 Caffeine-induced death protein [Neofusicoccum parvum]
MNSPVYHRLRIDFLRLSRATIDDSITQNLNSLLTPASAGFDPSSTNTRSTLPPGTRRQIPTSSCQYFKDKVLFPSWQVRSDVLSYCTSVATSPDPDDPVSILREVEDAKVRERIVNERLDPYSARYFPKELRTEMLANVIRNELMIESIIRSRTWGLVAERCGDEGRGFEDALNEWRRKRENGQIGQP